MMTPVGLTRDGHLVPKFRREERNFMIYKNETYTDENGQTVIVRYQLDRNGDIAAITYHVTCTFQFNLPNGRKFTSAIPVDLVAVNIGEAFAKIPQALKDALPLAEAELKKALTPPPGILLAGAAEAAAISAGSQRINGHR